MTSDYSKNDSTKTAEDINSAKERESEIEQTFLFPSPEIASSVAQNLTREFGNLKWDGCNGVNILFDEGEDYLFSEFIENSAVFQTIIGLENTEYCLKHRNGFGFIVQSEFIQKS